MRNSCASELSKAALNAAVVALLFAAAPDVAHGARDRPRPPPISLDSLSVKDEAVTAETTDGRLATLTLSPTLQRATQRLLAAAHPKSGAVVAVDPVHGRVLAWVGVRGNDPAPRFPAEALVPAASLFKLVTTTALLERFVPANRTVCIQGGSGAVRREHLRRPMEGRALCAPFREALGRSRNAVFAQLATRYLSPNALTSTARGFGFGADVPADITAKMGELDLPSGDLPFARAAAGFVGSTLSPVGAAHMATTVATLGRALRLRLVEQVGEYRAPRGAEVAYRAMREGTARELTRMMEVTVVSGTSREVFADDSGASLLGDVRVAGKTGTLQGDPGSPVTSWFIGFAPSRNPKIAVSVLLENGTGWREKANEVGRDVLRAFFAARGARGVTSP